MPPSLCLRTGLDLMDWFCGLGGSSFGAHLVPGVNVRRVANHWQKAIDSHRLNFPSASHWKGDIREAPVENWPVCEIFWASPECTKWSKSRGKKRTFHQTRQDGLFDPRSEEQKEQDAADERSRALMDEVPKYLDGVQRRGGLVLAGIVENVTDEREWDEFDRWRGDLHKLGYKTRVIALNSMHAAPVRAPKVPQSRNRLYVGYWHRSLGRDPDWDKWLRPQAWCPTCDEQVQAMQVFKDPGRDMGSYGVRNGSYIYRCPHKSCRNQIVEPPVLPAAAAIDWSMPGTRIGDRPRGLAPKTLARIEAGLRDFARPVLLGDAGETGAAVPPMLVPSGGTWRNSASSLFDPMPTRTTTESDALAIPPLLIPQEGREDKRAFPSHRPLRTQTTRNELGLAWLPYIVPMRGGGDAERARSIDAPLHTVTAGGNHHGLVTPPGFNELDGIDWRALLVPYYSNGNALPITEPVGTITTRDRWALVSAIEQIDLNDVLYRMLEPPEIGAGMGFIKKYRLAATSKRDQVKLYGNAVTPAAAEVLVSALYECVTGETLERHAPAA